MQKHFHSHFPDFLTVFQNVVNGNPTLFQNAIQLFRDLTYELQISAGCLTLPHVSLYPP